MATTTNFGWETPDDTDLVKDGALAIRTLGSAIDTSLVDLKGGTTGQVLSKTSNTDMDFTWVTSDDANAIQNAIVDAKGDLIAASAADTPARLAVGNNGETLVADSSASQGLRWQGNFAAGKNKVLNSDFSIWQRSTSATITSEDYYTCDRWRSVYVAGGATVTWSRQTFTPGAAPVAGYESQYFSRISATSGSGTTVIGISQRIEDVRTLAGQTATLSFWAKTDSARTMSLLVSQIFGTGGSSGENIYITTQAATTSWTRYSFTFSVPSISGKTIGTNSYVVFYLYLNTGAASGSPQLDIWGVQLEAGNTATAFQTATGTLAGELQAAQRYYYRIGGDSVYQLFGNGIAYSTTQANILVPLPANLRTSPSSIDSSTLALFDGVTVTAATVVTSQYASRGAGNLNITVASGLTQYRPVFLLANNSTSAYIGFNAEL